LRFVAILCSAIILSVLLGAVSIESGYSTSDPSFQVVANGINGEVIHARVSVTINGEKVSGYTPFFVPSGFSQVHNITISDHGKWRFYQWDEGSKNHTRTYVTNGQHTLTAIYYDSESTEKTELTVSSKRINQFYLDGIFVVVYNNGKIVHTGKTLTSYMMHPDQTYKVIVIERGPWKFSHWDDESISRVRITEAHVPYHMTAYFTNSTNIPETYAAH
jgi:hypothetical protein